MSLLLQLLAILRSLHWAHWTSHWKSSGKESYQNHLLFERLYTGVTEDIDSLAEKIVGEFGPDSISDASVMSDALRFVAGYDQMGKSGMAPRALAMEEHLQKAIKTTYEELKGTGQLSLGMDDFLMALANSHETNIYLLRQNLRTASSVKRSSLDRFAALTQPKSMQPVFKDNAMAVPIYWGNNGTMDPYNVARAMTPLYDKAPSGVAYVLDKNRVFAAAGLNKVAEKLADCIRDLYSENLAMVEEYAQGAPRGSQESKMVDREVRRLRALDNLKVRITEITSPTSGLKGLKVVFDPPSNKIQAI